MNITLRHIYVHKTLKGKLFLFNFLQISPYLAQYLAGLARRRQKYVNKRFSWMAPLCYLIIQSAIFVMDSLN